VTRAPASVVIVSRNRRRLLRETVESLLACPAVPAEVVVVDQSDDLDAELAKLDPGIRYVHAAARGLSRSRNDAARLAAHDVLVFVDDDMRAKPGWLSALLDAVGEDERTVATGRVTAGPAEVARAARPPSAEGATRAAYEGPIETDVLAGGNVALRRSALLDAGGWDERLGPGTRFPAAEDNDLGLRLLQRGYRIVFVPEAELVHRAWRSRRGGLALRWRYGRGKGGFYLKHGLRRRLAADLAKRARRFPRRLVRERGLAAADVLYSLGVLAGALHWAVASRGRSEPAIVREAPRRRRREVALTFDDGPSPWTERILELLERGGAAATFFVLGAAVAGREQLLRRAATGGHELGNHLFTHRAASELSDDELEEELERTRATILAAADVDTRLVRPPYGKQAHRVAAAAHRLGLGPTVLWSIETHDWVETEAAAIAERVLEAVQPGAIVLLHDGVPDGERAGASRDATVAAVERLLDELPARGYRLVTVSELLR
jgi:peptidoglycan/xylan/chitin deacetylase (PgdA/CDA1 family)